MRRPSLHLLTLLLLTAPPQVFGNSKKTEFGSDLFNVGDDPQDKTIDEKTNPDATTPSSAKAGADGTNAVSNDQTTSSPAPAPAPRLTTTPPPSEENHAKVMEFLKAGDKKGAWQAVHEGLRADPQDAQLQAVAKLLDRHVQDGLEDEALRAKAAGLLSAWPQPDVVLASPVAWAKAARAPQPTTAHLTAPGDIARQGLLKINLQDYAGAERDLTWRLEKNPSDWLSWRLRSLARHRLKKYHSGLEDATRALELNPRDAWSYKVRAMHLMGLGHPKEAYDDVSQALGLDPNDAGALVSRSQALAALGRSEEALADLARAADLDPQFAALYKEALRASARPRFARLRALYGAAAGLSLLIFSLALLKRRDATTRRAMRAEDRPAPLDTPAGRPPKGFRVLKRLGQGGMGVVYEAEDLALERKVALKRLRDEIAAEPRERRRLLREARTVASLKHPNIVEIYSVLEQEDALYLVFEHLNGKPLDRVLDERKTMPPTEALAVLRQMAAALDYAHGQGVVHQDLKPANVMLLGEVAKVTDFGIARRAQETLSTIGSREIVGTPAYMAPEQEQGLAGKEADLFALGVCAYELLGGRRPFAEGSALMQKLQMAFQPLSALSPSFPRELDAVIARALHPDPLKRFPSAQELYKQLERTLRA